MWYRENISLYAHALFFFALVDGGFAKKKSTILRKRRKGCGSIDQRNSLRKLRKHFRFYHFGTVLIFHFPFIQDAWSIFFMFIFINYFLILRFDLFPLLFLKKYYSGRSNWLNFFSILLFIFQFTLLVSCVTEILFSNLLLFFIEGQCSLFFLSSSELYSVIKLFLSNGRCDPLFQAGSFISFFFSRDH